MLFNELFNSTPEPLDEGVLDNSGQEHSPVASAIIRRILLQRTDLLSKYGPEKVGAAVDDVADFVGDEDEIGSSDVSGWVRQVEQMLGNMTEAGYKRDAYQRDYDNSVAGMGKRQSYAYSQDGGGNDERHDLDPTEWYIVKDGKMFKATVYPNQVQSAMSQGFSPSREEAKAKAGNQGVAEGLVGDVVVHNYTKIPIDLEPGQAQIAGWGPNDEPLYRVKGQDGKEVKTWSKRRMLTIAKEQGVAEAAPVRIGSKLPQSDTETFGLEPGRGYKINNPKDWKPGDRPRAVQQLIPTQDKKDHIRSRLGKHASPVLPEQGVAEGKIKLSTDPNWYGAEVGDYRASGPVVNIPANRLVGFEPDDKMNQPASKANVEKIVAGLKQGAKLPPLMVRHYKNGYQVLDGHHRFWAYKLLGVKSIPAQVVPAEDIEEITKQGVAEGLHPMIIDDVKKLLTLNPVDRYSAYSNIRGYFKADPALSKMASDIMGGYYEADMLRGKYKTDAAKAKYAELEPMHQAFIKQALSQDQGVEEGDISQIEKDIAAAPVAPIASMEGSDEKIGNMDADAFDAAMARLKKLAGAGPMKTVWDPTKRVYRNMPTAVQPAQQPKK